MKPNKEKTVCQYCGSQQLPNGEWISKDAVYSPRFPQSKNASHTPCKCCYDKQMKIIEDMQI